MAATVRFSFEDTLSQRQREDVLASLRRPGANSAEFSKSAAPNRANAQPRLDVEGVVIFNRSTCSDALVQKVAATRGVENAYRA